ncbi:ComEC/Rec2 family competence protein [Gorillibacterium sp. sgz500922]|uniref:ComEC/Rec2 family competence protein n=1 Tax=Gorillibacterium sp. sgz500922 TaxID=3446694 RepID=UPI003F66BBF6
MKSLLVQATAAWVLGYAAAIGFGPVPQAARWMIPVGFAVLAAALPAIRQARPLSGKRTLALLLLVGAAACLFYSGNDERNRTKLPAANAEELNGVTIEATGAVLNPVEVDGDRAILLLRTTEVTLEGDAPLKVREKLRVTVRLQSLEEQRTAAGWRRGDTLRLTGELLRPEPARNFGGFDYRAYLRRQHIHYQLSAKGAAGVERLPASPSISLVTLERTLDRVRSTLSAKLAGSFPDDQSGYMNGLVLGITDGIDPEQYDRFSGLGLTHLLAISGMHVAVFIGALLWIFRRLRMPRETAIILILLLLPLYVLLTGAAPSIVRAGLMAALGLFATLRGRTKEALRLIGLAALAMLVWNPYYVLDVGFQLSFLVTAGLVLGVTPLSRLLPIRRKKLNAALSVALMAQLVSFPLTVYYFNQISFLSLAANLLLVSVVSFVVTPGGTLAMLAALVHPGTAKLLAWPVVVLNRVTFGLVEGLNAVPGMKLVYPTPPVWWIPLYYACGGLLLSAALRAKESRQLRRTGIRLPDPPGPLPLGSRFGAVRQRNAAACLLAVLLVSGCTPPDARQTGIGTVSFLDVGQGDSILIRTPGNRILLVDGGGTVRFRKPGEEWKERSDPYEVGKKLLVPLLKKRGIGKIDTLIVSHLDEDHIGGLQAVVEEITVHRILFNGTLKKSESVEKLFRTALGKQIPVEEALSGSRYRPDGETELMFLNPTAPSGDLVRAPDQNGQSLVFTLDMLGRRFLFPGDAGEETERAILNAYAELAGGRPVDVLKVGHHGSRTSTTAAWLAYWQPEYAVISAGKNNSYGHPSPDTLTRLAAAEARVFRTDEDGEIRMKVSRKALSIERKLAGANE